MKDFLTKLIGLLITEPSAAGITENISGNLITLDISSPGSEIGRLIGKNGNIIRSIRSLLKLKGLSEGKQVVVRLTEPQDNKRS